MFLRYATRMHLYLANHKMHTQILYHQVHHCSTNRTPSGFYIVYPGNVSNRINAGIPG